ncbi:DinB family protein [Flavobacterium sp. CYK-4]|uniref:DinB family protein n=1 Tax=Flavobacterium lotistagni TaxID=2709660 RepID=UPI00140CD19C|nr:DinB family protein [Flavobacterium lotistagni]NHM06933.1 DinB family protein [Flavobacterium lotistagni]
MDFNISQAITVLERTPKTLDFLLSGMEDSWIFNNEGEESWSPYDVLGHLIHGEKTDWIVRMDIILSDQPERTFATFDRFAQFESNKGKTFTALMEEFQSLRSTNINILKSKNLTDDDLAKTGIHPALGTVTLKELLATWVVHDLGHIAQISRVMAKQYQNEVGPWQVYLPILSR